MRKTTGKVMRLVWQMHKCVANKGVFILGTIYSYRATV